MGLHFHPMPDLSGGWFAIAGNWRYEVLLLRHPGRPYRLDAGQDEWSMSVPLGSFCSFEEAQQAANAHLEEVSRPPPPPEPVPWGPLPARLWGWWDGLRSPTPDIIHFQHQPPWPNRYSYSTGVEYSTWRRCFLQAQVVSTLVLGVPLLLAVLPVSVVCCGVQKLMGQDLDS